MDEKGEKLALSQEQLDILKKELNAEIKKDAVEDLVVETYQPKKNCRKCYGTGRIGFVEGDPNKPYYCNCIVKIKRAVKVAAKPADAPQEVPQEVTPVEVKNDAPASV
jgi:hypothetical protein